MGLVASRAGSRSGSVPRRLPRGIIVLAVLLVLAATAAVFANRFLEVYRLGREAARLEALKRNFQEQNAVLREEIKLLQTPAYVEKIAREQLGLVKPGEIAVLIVMPPAPMQSAQPQAAPTKSRQSRISLLARVVQGVRRLFSR